MSKIWDGRVKVEVDENNTTIIKQKGKTGTKQETSHTHTYIQHEQDKN